MSTSDTFDFGGEPEQELPPLSDYGQRFIEKVPEEEKPYAEKYVREWDAGVTKLKGSYEEKLQTYSKLGDFEDVQAGVQLYRMLTGGASEQQKIVDYLAEQGVTAKEIKQMQKDAKEALKPEAEERPWENDIKELKQAVGMTAQQQRDFFAQQEQKRAYDEYVGFLKEAEAKHGSFDVDYVTYLLSQGKAQTMDEAVAAAQKLNPGQQRRATTPNLLGASSSAPPIGGKKPDYGNMPEKDIGKLLVHRLEQAREANG